MPRGLLKHIEGPPKQVRGPPDADKGPLIQV